ncbi:hypothetical protein F9047_11090 [Escherichia coli]|nr:hypothetical protein F9047_11090 [Escherichia coli]
MFPFAIIPPFVLSGKEKIKQFSVTSYDSMVLTDKGNLYVTGFNRVGELGVGDTTNRNNQWVLVMQDVNWIASNREKLWAIKNDGSIYTPDLRSSSTTAYTWQIDTVAPGSIGDLSGDNIKEIYSDTESVYILKKDGSLWYLGNNSKGQAGNGGTSLTTRFVKVSDGVVSWSSSGPTVVFVKTDGYFWGCGSNSRNIISSAGSSITTPTRMFSTTHADGGVVTDYTLASDQAFLIRYSNGKYRTKGLNIGQLPSGDASPYNTLTDVPDGYTPGDGTEPLVSKTGGVSASGTWPNYSGLFFYHTGGKFIVTGQASGRISGTSQTSGTLSNWTNVDAASDEIPSIKGMTFGLGWVAAYNDTQILYWGYTGNSSAYPVVGYLMPGPSRLEYVARFATPPIEA